MKKTTLIILTVAAFTGIALTGCAGAEKKQDTPTEAVTEGYQCPMKCTEEIFLKPDTCKVCGMDLEKITKS